MKKQQLIKVLEELDFFPGRQLGQNFLIDANMRDFIVRTAAPSPDEPILEIGPGFGVMTRELLKSGAQVTAIEIDKRLCDYLRGHIDHASFRLIEGDACRVDLSTIPGLNGAFRCIANLPYSASTPMITRFIDMDNPPRQMLFMLQKEMADRLTAKSRTKAYGALSVQVQHLYHIKTERIVPKQVFYPMPEVDSAVVNFVLRENHPSLEQRKRLKLVVRTAFSQRRKKMLNLLAQNFDKAKCVDAFKRLAISTDVRAEHLEVETYSELSDLL